MTVNWSRRVKVQARSGVVIHRSSGGIPSLLSKHQTHTHTHNGDDQADAGRDCQTVSRDQIIRRRRGQGNHHFPCSDDHEQGWQHFPR